MGHWRKSGAPPRGSSVMKEILRTTRKQERLPGRRDFLLETLESLISLFWNKLTGACFMVHRFPHITVPIKFPQVRSISYAVCFFLGYISPSLTPGQIPRFGF